MTAYNWRTTLFLPLLFGAMLNLSGCANPSSEKPQSAQYGEFERVLILGDSIALGYGALGHGPDCENTRAKLSPKNSFGVILADMLGASVRVNAVSGRGLVRNFANIRLDTAAQSLVNAGTLKRRYTNYNPDLILVHIGTNDFYEHDANPEFERSYDVLLKLLVTGFPEARIVTLIGPMLHGDDLERATRSIEMATNLQGLPQEHISFVALRGLKGSFGCDLHPSAASQSRMAVEILEELAVTAVGK